MEGPHFSCIYCSGPTACANVATREQEARFRVLDGSPLPGGPAPCTPVLAVRAVLVMRTARPVRAESRGPAAAALPLNLDRDDLSSPAFTLEPVTMDAEDGVSLVWLASVAFRQRPPESLGTRND